MQPGNRIALKNNLTIAPSLILAYGDLSCILDIHKFKLTQRKLIWSVKCDMFLAHVCAQVQLHSLRLIQNNFQSFDTSLEIEVKLSAADACQRGSPHSITNTFQSSNTQLYRHLQQMVGYRYTKVKSTHKTDPHYINFKVE